MISRQKHRKNVRKFRADIAAGIKNLREFKNLSIEEVSKGCGVPAFLIERIESKKGYLNMGAILQMARFYDRKVSIVFDEND